MAASGQRSARPALALLSLLSPIVMGRPVSNTDARAACAQEQWRTPGAERGRCPRPGTSAARTPQRLMEDGAGKCRGGSAIAMGPPGEAQGAPACDCGARAKVRRQRLGGEGSAAKCQRSGSEILAKGMPLTLTIFATWGGDHRLVHSF